MMYAESIEFGVGVVMEKLRKACVLNYKSSIRSPTPKFNNKITELKLSQFFHYCS